jgi:uncharacterized membrane protein YesL
MKTKRREKRLVFEGGFHYWIEKLFDAVSLNLIWLLFSLPVITVGASSTALYYTAVKVLRGDRGHLFSEFRRSFKLNFFKATVLWLAFAALVFLVLINRNIAFNMDSGYFGLFLVCLYTALSFALAALALYAFPVLSRFEMGLAAIIKMSLYMCFRYLHCTAALLVIFSASVFLIYRLPAFIFFLPCFAVTGASYIMEKVLIRHTPKDADGDKWYLNPANGGIK